MANWSREELLIALNLYCQMPFGKMYARNPIVARIAERIGRTPSALAMKLTNFASLDPAITESGRRGLANASKADRAIWNEMQSDWLHFAVEADRANEAVEIAHELTEPTDTIESTDDAQDYTGKGRPVEAVARVGQRFFRRAVLSAYQYRCCITGLSSPALLLASHIVPWRTDPSNRLNPRNGLCLSALHDRAFDAGLITVGEDLRVWVSVRYVPSADPFFDSTVLQYDGRPIRLPDKFQPRADFLEYHRTRVFRG